MVKTSPRSISTPLPARSVPSVPAVNASGGMIECSPTTADSARSRSKLKSSARGWIAAGTFHSVNEGIRVLRFPGALFSTMRAFMKRHRPRPVSMSGPPMVVPSQLVDRTRVGVEDFCALGLGQRRLEGEARIVKIPVRIVRREQEPVDADPFDHRAQMFCVVRLVDRLRGEPEMLADIFGR